MSKKEPWEWVCDYCGTSGRTTTDKLGWLALVFHVTAKHPKADLKARPQRHGIVHRVDPV